MRCAFLIALILPLSLWADSPVLAVDRYFKSLANSEVPASYIFTKDAMISSVVYDTNGKASLRTMVIEEFERDMEAVRSNYFIHQEPVVLLNRTYGQVSSIYCSVWMQFVDNQTSDTLIARSMQSIRLVKQNEQWRVAHVLIQMEHPNYPIAEIFWPEEITQNLVLQSSMGSTDSDVYDTTVVYEIAQLDEPPVYPGPPQALDALMKQFGITAQPQAGYVAFDVVLAEDGSATLYDTSLLTPIQVNTAQSFVRSMLIWYPAIKYAASVKCKLTFFIHE